jgi:hypothetical protein
MLIVAGGSHDRTDLLPLKAGVSVMALGAMANDPTVQVKIVPVGLSYFHAHKFRSRAVVEFGSALDVPNEFIEMFKQGGTQKREAVSKFLDLIYDALKTVTVRAPDYDTLMVSQDAHLWRRFLTHCYLVNPSCQKAVQNTKPTFNARPSSRAQQTPPRGLHSFQRRTACTKIEGRCSQVQPSR